MAKQQQPRQWYTITNKADSGAKKTAELLIYDDIGRDFFGDGVDAGQLANELNALEVDEITVGINSRGGNVFDGIAIFNALKRHPATVTTRVDGLAASAASFIAQAGDNRQISKYGQAMVHDAQGMAQGDAKTMRQMADTLNTFSNTVAQMYADRAGGDVKDFRKLMAAETWFNADEFLAAGLADEVIAGDPALADATNRFDLSIFNHAGRLNAPAPCYAFNQSSSTVSAGADGKGADMAVKEEVAKRLGVDAELDDDALLEKLDEKLAPPADPVEPAEPTPAELQAAAAKAGLKLVDADTLAALQSQAALGAEAHASLAAAQNSDLVDQAIRDGKIPPAARDKYLTGLREDRDTFSARLEALEPGTIPLEERGHSVQSDSAQMQAPDDLSWFDSAPRQPATDREGV